MIRRAAFVLALCAAPVAAQQVSEAPGAVLRGLDKINGRTVDLDLAAGASTQFGTLKVTLGECRYPVGNPSGDAFAELEISETGQIGTLFSGWMIASSPALSAMDHPRYDIWVMRCTTS